MSFPSPRRITVHERLVEVRKCIREGDSGGALNELMFLEGELAKIRKIAEGMVGGWTGYDVRDRWGADILALIGKAR